MDAMEGLEAAAVRETLEEAGIHVRLTGVLNVEYTPRSDRPQHTRNSAHAAAVSSTSAEAPSRTRQRASARVKLRVVFLAQPVDEGQPGKMVPDFESAGSVWATGDEIAALHSSGLLRGSEPAAWAAYVSSGRAVADLSLLRRQRVKH